MIKPRPNPTWIQPRDCRPGMAEMGTNSVSLILTDPPYFMDGMGNEWSHSKLKSRIKPGVIGGLPAGMKFDRKQGQNLYSFIMPIAEEWLRILKPGGFALCFSQPRLVHRMAVGIEDAGFEIRDVLAWTYKGQQGQIKAFTQDHFVRKRNLSADEEEKIISSMDGRRTPQLRAQMELIILAQSPRDGTFVDNWMAHKTGLIDVDNPVISPDRFPGQVIHTAKTNRKLGHMTTKPVDLLRHLIRIFSASGEDVVVFDPFAGSGSTGVAARMEGRGFAGFEKDAEMAYAADSRVEDAVRRKT